MRYIVLDTNCLLQSLPSRSPYHKIWSDVIEGKISLCVNTDILEEYAISWPKVEIMKIQDFINLIR